MRSFSIVLLTFIVFVIVMSLLRQTRVLRASINAERHHLSDKHRTKTYLCLNNFLYFSINTTDQTTYFFYQKKSVSYLEIRKKIDGIYRGMQVLMHVLTRVALFQFLIFYKKYRCSLRDTAESNSTRNLFYLHLHGGSLNCPRDIHDVFIKKRDTIPSFPNILYG